MPLTESNLVGEINRTSERLKKFNWRNAQKDALKHFQKLRRMQEADHNGYCQCISCPKKKHFKEMDGGHYKKSKDFPNVSFDPVNVWPQCPYCNDHLGGNEVNYRINLIQKVGILEVLRIEKTALGGPRMEQHEYEKFYAALAVYYRKLVLIEAKRFE